jgi:hypothetical protein
MVTIQRVRLPGLGVAAVLLGVSLGTYAARRLTVSQKLGNRVLDVLDLDEPLSTPPIKPADQARRSSPPIKPADQARRSSPPIKPADRAR